MGVNLRPYNPSLGPEGAGGPMAAGRGPWCRGPAAGTKRTDLTTKRPEEVEGEGVGAERARVDTGREANAAAEAEAAAALGPTSLHSLALLSGMLSIPKARHLAILQAMHPRKVGVMLHELRPPRHSRTALAQFLRKN